MYSLLLRKALPFALTFIIGSLVGGLFKSVGIGGLSAERGRSYFHGHGGRRSCGFRARQRYLVAESKPLQITFKPDARRPHMAIKNNGLESMSCTCDVRRGRQGAERRARQYGARRVPDDIDGICDA